VPEPRDINLIYGGCGTSEYLGSFLKVLKRSPKLIFGLLLALAPWNVQAWEVPVEMGLMACSFAAPSSPLSTTAPEDIIGGHRDVECSFAAGLEAPRETYVGTLRFVGQPSEVLGKGILLFVAKAPQSLKSGVGTLQGKYTIRALAPTGSQRPLIGQSDTSIILHPLRHKYDEPTLALGHIPGLIVTLELTLKSAPT